MDDNRLKHSLMVAQKMKEIALEKGLSEVEANNCFLIGFNHDIGYYFTQGGINHHKIGGNILKVCGFEFWQEVYNHGEFNPKYKSIYLDILNQADMQIDRYGNDVGYDGRLQDIKKRYGEDSKEYQNCSKLIKKYK